MDTNYIVACYLGQRRTNHIVESSTFVTRHLEWLSKVQPEIDRVSFVINRTGPEDVELMIKLLDSYSPFYTELKLFTRSNIGFSYGAWSDTINASIGQFDHYFCIEDDYLPTDRLFIDKFKSRLRPGVGYVCQKVFDAIEGGFPRHAAISNGLLDGSAAEKVHEAEGTVLKVEPAHNYAQAERNQIHFTDLLVKHGYDFVDTSNISSTVFLEKFRDSFVIKKFDLDRGPALLRPIYEM